MPDAFLPWTPSFDLLYLPENQSKSGVLFMLAESFLAITALTALLVVGLAALAKLLFGE